MHYCGNMKHTYIWLLIFYFTTPSNGSFLNTRGREYTGQRNPDTNKLVKSASESNINSGLVEDAAVTAVGEVFVPKTFSLSSQEPSCEQLRAMWIFSKRQSRAAEITNEIPTYRDPFTYNVWEPLYSNSRLLGSIRMGTRERPRSPVFGRVVSREPIIPQRINYEQRQRHLDGSPSGRSPARLYGAEMRPLGGPQLSSGDAYGGGVPSSRRTSQNRYVGVPNNGNQNSVAVQGSFQKLKELIWTERAKELTQQRRAEELAARAAVLKEIANGQNFQSSYSSPFTTDGDSVLMDENRSPDASGPLFMAGDQLSTSNMQNLDVNDINAGHRNSAMRASTRRIGNAYATIPNGQGRKAPFVSSNTAASQAKSYSRIKIPAAETAGDSLERDQTTIGIPRTYPVRQSHFRERNRSLLKEYLPKEYFHRNNRRTKQNVPDFYINSQASKEFADSSIGSGLIDIDKYPKQIIVGLDFDNNSH